MFFGGTPETAAMMAALPEEKGKLLFRYHSLKISEIKPQMDADGRG